MKWCHTTLQNGKILCCAQLLSENRVNGLLSFLPYHTQHHTTSHTTTPLYHMYCTTCRVFCTASVQQRREPEPEVQNKKNPSGTPVPRACARVTKQNEPAAYLRGIAESQRRRYKTPQPHTTPSLPRTPTAVPWVGWRPGAQPVRTPPNTVHLEGMPPDPPPAPPLFVGTGPSNVVVKQGVRHMRWCAHPAWVGCMHPFECAALSVAV